MTLTSLLLEDEGDMAFVSEFNRRILSALAEEAQPITLGMLPFGACDTDRCIALVHRMCGGSGGVLNTLLGKSECQALVAYSLAATVSRAVQQGGIFWPPLSQHIGIDFGKQSDRKNLSREFCAACGRLGVIDPDVSALGWTDAAPIMAQASLLHSWVEALVAGMKTTLNQRPLPDLEDSKSLERFAVDLASHIHNHQNLSNILRTEAGRIVAHRLISSCIYGRFDMLPAHLVKPMREAFESKGGQVSLKSPYVSFDPGKGSFELVLPKQPAKLVKAATCWVVNGAQYPPQIERRLSEFEVGRGNCPIRLRYLECGYQDQTFDLEVGLSEAFRVFDQQTLRERAIGTIGQATLPPGEYTLVMQTDCTTDLSEYEEERNGYRILSDVALRPGVEPVRIRHDSGECTLCPALKAGIYHSSDEGSSAALEDGSRLHFGAGFGFLVYIPKDQHSGKLSITVTRRDEVIFDKSTDLKSTDEGVYDYSSNLEGALADSAARLEPGIHPLRILVSTGVTAVSRGLWYWKGLDHISHQMGFKCQAIPSNIKISKCRGLEFHGNDIRISPNFRAPRVVIALTDGDEALALPRPGVRAVCVDPSEGDTTELSAGESIMVRADDSRVVEFESGGFETWAIRCNGQEVARLEPKRPRFQMGLRSLTATHGKSGAVDAISADGASVRLFSFTAGLVAKRLNLEMNHGLGIEKWETALPVKDLGRVAIRVLDMGQSPDPVDEPVTVVFTEGMPSDADEGSISVCDGVSVSIRCLAAAGNQGERLKLALNLTPGLLASRFLMIEVLQAPLGAEEWQVLQCADGPTTSRLCIVATGGAPFEPGTSSWWHHLWRVRKKMTDGEEIPLYQSLVEETVCHALGEISRLAAIKYPSAVYSHSAGFLSTLAHRLAERRDVAGFTDSGAWWEAGAAELEVHASTRIAPVVRQFLFAANPNALRRHWCWSENNQSGRAGLITESFKLCQRVRLAGGRVAYTATSYHEKLHPHELFWSFENWVQVRDGLAPDFNHFDFKGFLGPIFHRVLQHEDLGILSEEDIPVLSARHLLWCIQALNRRVRILARASKEDADHPLGFALQALASAYGVIEGFIPNLNGKIGYKTWARVASLDNHGHYDAPNAPDLPLLASPQAEQLNGLVWALCVLSRGTAHGRMPGSTFAELLPRVSHDSLHKRPINLALSFAPELFAYYTALLDFALYNPIPES
jgi:hypothetical protein